MEGSGMEGEDRRGEGNLSSQRPLLSPCIIGGWGVVMVLPLGFQADLFKASEKFRLPVIQ